MLATPSSGISPQLRDIYSVYRSCWFRKLLVSRKEIMFFVFFYFCIWHSVKGIAKVKCYGVRYDFRIKAMFGSSLPLVVCMRAHVLLAFLCLFAYCGFQNLLTIWITWRVSYKRQEMFAFACALVHARFVIRKGNNKITELRTILQKESQDS